MQKLTDIQKVAELQAAIEFAKNKSTQKSDDCPLCFGSGFTSQLIGGYRTATPCHCDIDQHRERIAIEVEHLDNAQEAYESRI